LAVPKKGVILHSKSKKMRTITIHILDKNSSKSMSETVKIDGRTKDSIKKQVDDLFDSIPFSKWYYEVESYDDLTDEETQILEELELEIDY